MPKADEVDRDRLAALGALVLVAGGAWWYLRARQVPGAAMPAQPLDLAGLDFSGLAEQLAPLLGELERAAQPFTYMVEDVVQSVNTAAGGAWTPPDRAQPYLAAIYAAEDRHGMPRNLLARLIYQESRYREDIITGAVVSSAGAQGIAQIVPRWHPGARPLDPFHSIDYAANYLAQLKRQFGSWPLALAAYNWGPGNLQANGIGAAPRETRDYVAQISADVGLA